MIGDQYLASSISDLCRVEDGELRPFVRIGGDMREVNVCEGSSFSGSMYTIDAYFAGPVDKLDRDGFIRKMSEGGLTYSVESLASEGWDLDLGFNDKGLLGMREFSEFEDGKATEWIKMRSPRVGSGTVQLEFLPKVSGKFYALRPDEPLFGALIEYSLYAQQVLTTVVEYVENPANYITKPDGTRDSEDEPTLKVIGEGDEGKPELPAALDRVA